MVDAFHPHEVNNAFVDIPIHGLQEDVDTVIVVMERGVAEVTIRAIHHHATAFVVEPEAQAIMIDGIQADAALHRVGKIKAHHRLVGDQHIVLRQGEVRRLHLHHFRAVSAEMEHCLVVDAAKHFHHVAHHADATFEVDIPQQVRDMVVGTIGFHARIHGPFIRSIGQDLVLKTAQDILVEVVALEEMHRVDGKL